MGRADEALLVGESAVKAKGRSGTSPKSKAQGPKPSNCGVRRAEGFSKPAADGFPPTGDALSRKAGGIGKGGSGPRASQSKSDTVRPSPTQRTRKSDNVRPGPGGSKSAESEHKGNGAGRKGKSSKFHPPSSDFGATGVPNSKEVPNPNLQKHGTGEFDVQGREHRKIGAPMAAENITVEPGSTAEANDKEMDGSVRDVQMRSAECGVRNGTELQGWDQSPRPSDATSARAPKAEKSKAVRSGPAGSGQKSDAVRPGPGKPDENKAAKMGENSSTESEDDPPSSDSRLRSEASARQVGATGGEDERDPANLGAPGDEQASSDDGPLENDEAQDPERKNEE